jgi:site-specific recombinase XerD
MTYYKSMIEADLFRMLTEIDVGAQTKTNYEYYCRSWFNWWYERFPEGDPKDADGVLVAQWMATKPKWTSATRYAAVAALKKFYRYKYGQHHPVGQIKVRRVDPGPQRTLDKQEVMDILAALDTTTANGIRDLAILSLMIDTGIRASEVCNLELLRLDLKRMRFTVFVKGGYLADRLFFDYTRICLENWLSVREGIAQKDCRYVFVSIGGRTPGQQMTRSTLRYLTKKLSHLTGTSHFSAHALRRTFATLATENGAPTRVVQIAGGWKSIRMVERYTQALKQDAVKPYSPIDRLMND